MSRTPIMVREGPAEPAPANTIETPQERQARSYGMMFTSAIIALVIIVVAYMLVR
ncbi:hypothetical protein [Bradyrhizobium macuxiense]|nr:hypothetical protein [Bradyrhizobium macuxiense]